MIDILELVRPNIAALCPYSTARDECSSNPEVFLDANESPYPNSWNRYPDPHQKALKARIAELKGIKPENLFLGNGSDEAIDLLMRVFCVPGKDNIVAISPSYGMYSVAAATNDVSVREVLLRDDFSLDTEALLAACDSLTKLIFLCSPNNPSGNAFPLEQIEEIVSRSGRIVVVDEAYIDFSSVPSAVPLTDKYPNLAVLQTMSKARGMASLRLGLAIAHESLVRLMSMVKYPYNINGATQALALDLLRMPVEEQVREIVSERERLARELPRFSFVQKVYPSDANFLLVRVDDADALYGYLLEGGVIVRNRTRMPLCRACLRITVGLPSENDRMLSILDSYKR